MPKLNDMFPSKYVTGAELGGRSYPVTIARVVSERMRPNAQSPEVEKWVLYTVEGKRGIVLGKPLALQIAQALGADDTDAWQGKKIVIYPESVVVAGVQRVAIRARAYTNGNGKASE